MSFDRSDGDEHDQAHHRHEIARVPEPTLDAPQVRRSADASITADSVQASPSRVPTEAERLEAHRRAQQAVRETYAAWDRKQAGASGTMNGRTAQPDAVAAANRTYRDGTAPTRPPDKPSATVEALQARVAELEADKAARDRQLATQARTIAEQDQRIEHLESYVGRITTAVQELRQQQDESRPSSDIERRAEGGEVGRAEWSEPQHRRRLPTDAINNVISVAAGGVLTDLAFHVRELTPEAAGIGATGVALGAGIIAVWRDRKKAGDDDADHRPKG